MLVRSLSFTLVGAVMTICLAASNFGASTSAASTSTATTSAASASADESHPDAGPPCKFETELKGGGAVPLKDAAILTGEKCGYRYRAGQQNSHLVVTQVKDGLRFADTRTARFARLAPACKEIRRVRAGVAAVCRVPNRYSARQPLLVEVWPRLGHDYVDGSSLSAMFAMAVLADAGNDTVRLGAGPDFFNGAFGRDRVWGGARDDWLRTGDDGDRTRGGSGNDYLVGGDARDKIIGGNGADQIFCGNGADRARVDGADSIIRLCERVNRG